MAKFKNVEMDNMVEQLKPLLAYKNKAGYVAARNTRLLLDELTEYHTIRESLIQKYGRQEQDENGNLLPRVSIDFGSEEFEKFEREIKEFSEIEHEVNLMHMNYEEVIGELSGEEILAIDWMLDDEVTNNGNPE